MKYLEAKKSLININEYFDSIIKIFIEFGTRLYERKSNTSGCRCYCYFFQNNEENEIEKPYKSEYLDPNERQETYEYKKFLLLL